MNKIILYSICGLLMSSSVKCTKKFDELNTNPNYPVDVPNENLLVSAISKSVVRIHGANMNLTYAGLWSQLFAKIQYIDEDKYSYRSADMDAHWTALYSGPIQDLEIIIKKAEAEGATNMKAAAEVMRAYIYHVMTDVWGDIPYAEASKGVEILQPSYDTQQSIYKDLIARLSAASSAFDNSKDDISKGDILYSGNINSWIKFANSLNIRICNRIKHVDSDANSLLSTILDDPSSYPIFESNNDDAMLSYVGDNNYPNPFWENAYLDGRNDHAVSKTLTDILNAFEDPRLPVYAKPTANDPNIYEGQPNGTTLPSDFGAISMIGTYFRDISSTPSTLISYAEILFIKAERSGLESDFSLAVQASLTKHGLNASASFLVNLSSAFANNAQEAIATQKWIALYPDGIEAFNEFRRTGFPSSIVEVPQSVYSGKGVPMRFPYATTEFTTNGSNLNEAISAQNLDASMLFGTSASNGKMWWAK